MFLKTKFGSSSVHPGFGCKRGCSLYCDARISPSLLKTTALHPVVPISIPRRLNNISPVLF